MTESNRKADRENPDPSELEKLLELELMQKRAGWAQAKARRGTLRTLSYFFLVLVVLGAVVAFFIFLSSDHSSREQEEPGPTVESTAAPTTRP